MINTDTTLATFIPNTEFTSGIVDNVVAVVIVAISTYATHLCELKQD